MQTRALTHELGRYRLTGSIIGINMEATIGTFTSGYSTYYSGVDPSTLFFSDLPETVSFTSNGSEAQLACNVDVTYIERSWDNDNKVIASTPKTLTNLIRKA